MANADLHVDVAEPACEARVVKVLPYEEARTRDLRVGAALDAVLQVSGGGVEPIERKVTKA